MKILMLAIPLLLVFSCKKSECDSQPDNCRKKPDAGNCFAAFPKYYYDKEDKTCKEFTWGGCGGTVPFDTMEECEACLCND